MHRMTPYNRVLQPTVSRVWRLRNSGLHKFRKTTYVLFFSQGTELLLKVGLIMKSWMNTN